MNAFTAPWIRGLVVAMVMIAVGTFAVSGGFGKGSKKFITGEDKKVTTEKGELKPITEITRPGLGKKPRANKGKASIVFFYFGDSKYETLGQETQKLKLAMDGYKKVVLLKLDTVRPMWDLSEKDEKLADIKEAPTRKNLSKYIKQLADEGYYIDLWIFSHGWSSGFRATKGRHGSNENFTTSDIDGLIDPKHELYTGYRVLPLRMVYGVNCYGSDLNPHWTKVGAKTALGARYVNFFPNQFAKFARGWNKGDTVEKARDDANTGASRTLVHAYILAHAKSNKNKWGGCPFPKTVLGDHACAKDYFTTMWIAKSEWKNNQNGKKNMINSSKLLIRGDKKMTNKMKPTW